MLMMFLLINITEAAKFFRPCALTFIMLYSRLRWYPVLLVKMIIKWRERVSGKYMFSFIFMPKLVSMRDWIIPPSSINLLSEGGLGCYHV